MYIILEADDGLARLITPQQSYLARDALNANSRVLITYPTGVFESHWLSSRSGIEGTILRCPSHDGYY
jgi:hypothetical protein